MISCDQYDYIEIVCMHRYPIRLMMKSGSIVECTALDTQRNDAREECIKVEVQGAASLIPLDNIARLDVSVENPHFKTVSFL